MSDKQSAITEHTGSTESEQLTEGSDTAETADEKKDDMVDLEAAGSIEVEQGLLTVSVTVPKKYVGASTQAEIDSEAKEKGYISAVLNSDGSATFTMTKKQHSKVMAEMRDDINKSLTEMIGSESYPDITDIKANDDFTSFTITTKSKELSLTEGFSVIGFYMYGGLYNIYNGTPVDNIHVDFVNADTGEIINSSDSRDAAD